MPDSARSRRRLLELASQTIELPEELDVAGKLARHNLLYGMGRLIWTLKRIDSGASARFYASPDFTITRTPVRWGSGFSYGGVLEIKDCSPPVVFPELRPNTCGATLCVVEEEISAEDFLHRVTKLRFASGTTKWDYGRRNHFVNLYRSKRTGKLIVAVHGCCAANKKDTKEGPGLFFDRSDYWSAKTKWFETPLGRFAVLLDSDAKKFAENYERCEELSKADRLRVAREVGGEGQVLTNETHEGMVSLDFYVKGCQVASDLDSTFPVFTDIGSEAYLVSAPSTGNSFSTKLPKGLMAVLPHGTGYAISLLGNDLKTVDDDGRPLWIVKGEDGTLGAYADFSHVPYRYRPSRTVAVWEKRNHLKIRDRLLPVAFTKL